ncbi:MAG: hypothetical protein ACXWLG_07020 [Myxococcaceae bacterium]
MTSERPRVPLPIGYRQGIITAITVVLGFSLVFLRVWGFELPGEWAAASIASVILLGFSILGQCVTLWRSLQVEDDDVTEYKKTLRWFLGSTLVLLVAVLLSAISYSKVIGP